MLLKQGAEKGGNEHHGKRENEKQRKQNLTWTLVLSVTSFSTSLFRSQFSFPCFQCSLPVTCLTNILFWKVQKYPILSAREASPFSVNCHWGKSNPCETLSLIARPLCVVMKLNVMQSARNTYNVLYLLEMANPWSM